MDFIATSAFSNYITRKNLGRERFASSAGSNEEIHRRAMPVDKTRRVEGYKGGKEKYHGKKEKYYGKKEKFTGGDNPGPISIVLGTLVGIYAVYLSWSCNTKQGVNALAKVIYAIFAWIFGMLYLILYFLFRRPC